MPRASNSAKGSATSSARETKAPPHPLDPPDFLKRDPVDGKAPYIREAEADPEAMKRVEAILGATRPIKEGRSTVATAATGKGGNAKGGTPAAVKAAGGNKGAQPAKGAAKPAPAAKGGGKTAAVKGGEKDIYGFREGSLKSQAAAMYASKGGATLSEVKDKIGSSQLNLLTELEVEGWVVARDKETPKEGKKAVTRYFLRAKGAAKAKTAPAKKGK